MTKGEVSGYSVPHSAGDQHHRRKAMDHGKSKRVFKQTASHVHPKNLLSGAAVVNRGGIRL